MLSFNPKKMVGSNGKLIMRREVNIQRTKLEPGKYALVPRYRNVSWLLQSIIYLALRLKLKELAHFFVCLFVFWIYCCFYFIRC